MNKTAVILSNTGTPDAPRVKQVRAYLKEFLGDGRVITMHSLLRKMLVNGIIVPFRAPKSTKLYEKLWTPQGSPLLVHTLELQEKLQQQLGESYTVITGMRYGNPSLKDALERVREQRFENLIVMPLFPQYASSTVGSVMELVHRELGRWNNIPAMASLPQFYNHPGFIECFIEGITAKRPETYDHIIFSYHGLPLRHVHTTHKSMPCSGFQCTTQVNLENAFCYHATCYETTRLLAAGLKLSPEQYTVCFQSRFSQSWLSPFADEVIQQKAKQGVKRLLVVSPSFVTDCLETIVELGYEYRNIFMEHGGEQFDWVPSLNAGDSWVQTLADMIRRMQPTSP